MNEKLIWTKEGQVTWHGRYDSLRLNLRLVYNTSMDRYVLYKDNYHSYDSASVEFFCIFGSTEKLKRDFNSTVDRIISRRQNSMNVIKDVNEFLRVRND